MITDNKDYILKEELIYWIDKEFIQWRAKELFNNELNDEELEKIKKYVESGLGHCVFEIIDIAIKEAKLLNKIL